MKDLIKTVIFDQKKMGWKSHFVKRGFQSAILQSSTIVVISGVRR